MKHIILAAMVGVLVSGPAWAAEITRFPDGKYPGLGDVLIRGPIERGDLSKFKTVLARWGVGPSAVSLVSPGGDLVEAMKIGRLIRKLRLGTFAPVPLNYRDGKKVICWQGWGGNEIRPIEQAEECFCASACFFIFIAGVRRSGELLAVHRPYMTKDGSKKIELGEYEIKYREVEGDIRKYLTEMGVSQKWYDILLSTPSHEARFLSRKEVWPFREKPRDIAEWLHAQCSKLTPKERAIWDKLATKRDDVWRTLPSERKREAEALAFTEVELIIMEGLQEKKFEEGTCKVHKLSDERERAYKAYFTPDPLDAMAKQVIDAIAKQIIRDETKNPDGRTKK